MKCLFYIENKCKSCTYLESSYAESLKIKEAEFFDLFSKETSNYHGIVGVTDAEHSRNKAKLSLFEREGELQFGIYSRDQVFTSLESCPLHLQGINELLLVLRPLLIKYKITAYDLKSKKGELKNILITKSDTTNEMMLRFVVRSKESVDRLRLLAQELQSSAKNVELVSANIQPVHSAILEGEEEIIFTDRKTIIHEYDNLKLHLGVKSFFQVTSEMARNLYSEVKLFLEEKKVASLLDLYCGVGAFSFYASKIVPNVYGVEVSEAAIKCAELTKSENQIANVHFKALDVNKFWEELKGDFETILVNPPRAGVGEYSMHRIKKLAPKYIIYSSCNVETLHADFAHIQDQYKIISSKIFDMFPFSKHFEVLMFLEKKE